MPIVAPTTENCQKAADHLRAGGIVAMPTETVYGLAADATNAKAVAAIFKRKGRPQYNPLIVHATGTEQLEQLVIFPPLAKILAQAFWPGPMTLVLDRRPDCPVAPAASAGLGTLAVRVPRHAVARKLIDMTGRPLAAPSANVSGAVSPTRPEHVAAAFDLPFILDGGPCEVGLESTVLRVSNTKIVVLRPGSITAEMIEKATGHVPAGPDMTDEITAPGQLASHYAPQSPLRLNAQSVHAGEVLLAFGPPLPGAKQVCNLSPDGNLEEAAGNLFAMIRQLDEITDGTIAVMSIPDTGVGIAINDRLERAAAPRDHDDD